jgi:hypothetical protein
MAELDVCGSFLITIGRGAGPETWVVISVASEDGKPVSLTFPKDPEEGPVDIFIALSAMFGAFDIPLRIVEVQPEPAGFYGLRVEGPSDLGVRLEATRPSALGIVVDNGKNRGQALACSCGGAEVTAWFGDRTQERPR